MPKHPVPAARKGQRERPLDASTQLLLLALEKLPPTLDPALDQALLEDGSALIPGTVVEHFCVLLVLSRIGLAAQNAQRAHGVPASLLMAKYVMDYGWSPQHAGKKAEKLFLEEAKTLRRSSPAELHLLSSPVEYAITLHRHGSLVNRRTGESDWLYCLDVACRITEYGLLECDYRYGTGGLYDLDRDLCLEDVARVLGCSAELARHRLESGELKGSTRCSHSGRCSCEWRVGPHQLRVYVQRVQVEKLRKLGPNGNGQPAKTDASGLHLVPELAEPAAGPVADC